MLNLMLIAAGGPEHGSELKSELRLAIMEETTWIIIIFCPLFTLFDIFDPKLPWVVLFLRYQLVFLSYDNMTNVS